MQTYDIDQAAEILEDLLDRAASGETIGIIRNGRVAALISPLDEPASEQKTPSNVGNPLLHTGR